MSKHVLILQQTVTALLISVRVNDAETRYRPWLAATNAHSSFLKNCLSLLLCFRRYRPNSVSFVTNPFGLSIFYSKNTIGTTYASSLLY
ncbi:hypothetical protein GTU79_18500 [Sodalis ligni]|uniref:hypothetical protein n=1 Tax=Sodalis ligni TaxID=2697027 RepID=UPI001BDF5BE3|nr:hypothetical protein [Sodalis ligni]QWA09364.1 hypothetical protein GTU79_18500 [Sodalis ligni]